MKKQFAKVNTVIGVTELVSNDEAGVFLNEQQLEKIETNIDTLEKSVETEKANVITEKAATTAADTRANTAEATVATQATEITELKAQIVNLNKGAGAGTGGVVIESDDQGGDDSESKDDFMNTVASSRKLYNMLAD